MRWISDDRELPRIVADLERSDTYFIDTEFESTRQGTRLSVIQVSAGEEVYLLDALALTDWEGLAGVLIRDDCEWVLHAGLQDVELLLGALNRTAPPRLFDTQLAWALLTPEASVSLSYLVYRLLGIRSMKTHQADDWMRRPLPRAQLEYAAQDIAHLPELYRILSERLSAQERLWAIDAVCREALWPDPESASELSLQSFRNAWQLAPENQAALRFLIEWANQLSPRRRAQLPPPKTLLSVASRLPKTVRDLVRIKGIPPRLPNDLAEECVRGMRRAIENRDAGHFVEIEPEPYATFEAIRFDAWLMGLRAEVSARVGVAPELAFPGRTSRQLGRGLQEQDSPAPPSEVLDGWRRRLLGAAIDHYCQEHPPPSLRPDAPVLK